MRDKKPAKLNKANVKPPKPPRKNGIATGGFEENPIFEGPLRGALITKILGEITSAVKKGGSDPNTNIALKSLIEQASQYFHIPFALIENAVKKGAK